MSWGARLVETIFLLTVAVWVGAIVMFSFIVAPGIFGALPRSEAGDLMNRLFPVYYKLGALCSLAALLSGGIQAYVGRRWGTLRFWLTGLMVVSTFYAGFVVTPHAQAVRSQLAAGGSSADRAALQAAFNRDHQLAVFANGAALFSGVAILWLTGMAERRAVPKRPRQRLSN